MFLWLRFMHLGDGHFLDADALPYLTLIPETLLTYSLLLCRITSHSSLCEDFCVWHKYIRLEPVLFPPQLVL